MFPLFFVYFAEYFINQGLVSAFAFIFAADGPVLNRPNFGHRNSGHLFLGISAMPKISICICLCYLVTLRA